MAREIIRQIMDVEAECNKAVEDAMSKAETIKSEAKLNSKKYYEQEVSNAQATYEKKIAKAEEDAKVAIEKAESEGKKEQVAFQEKVKSKQEKAIKAVMEVIV